MKAKNLFFAVMMSFVVSHSAQAKVWRVDSNLGNTGADFTSMQAANDGAAAGDTLYVAGSAATYGSITFSKKLYIFGPGYFLSENPNTQANAASAFIDVVDFDNSPSSAGTVVTGMTFTNYVTVNASNIVLKRNYFIGAPTGTGHFIGLGNTITNFIFVGNFMSYSATTGYEAIQMGSSNSSIVIANNYISATTATNDAINSPTGSTISVINNVINGDVVMTGGNFDNNILLTGTFTGSGLTWFNNLGSSTQFGTANGNQQNVDMSAGACFVAAAGTTTDSKWQLHASSPAIAAGVAGIDCGMFGGSSPYVLSGIPSIPTIYYFSSPVSGSNSQGLPVTIKVKSRN